MAVGCPHSLRIPHSAQYTYLANSPLVDNIVFAHSGATRMTTTNRFDVLNRLTSITNEPSGAGAIGSRYVYNDANQRTTVTNADTSRWVYTYDKLGQVISGKKYWSDNTPVAGQQFEYAFDDIGNRRTNGFGGNEVGLSLRESLYTVNDLNQYTSRTVPGYVNVLGDATNTASVSVNTNLAYRKDRYFRAELGVNNSANPIWLGITNVAVMPNGASSYVVSNVTGHVFVPKTPESFGYDADGNLTNDGRWALTWDAENRLVNMTSLSSGPAGSKLKLDFSYDHQGRRMEKVVSTWNGSSYASPSTNRFVYDGWNLIAILNSAFSLQHSFMWGLDLSGTMQGAGGVGGLLAANDSANGTHFAGYDGNGNVTAQVKTTDGTASANYEYGPFGELLRATGPLAKANPFRFSTKYQDDESDLLYYGYRSYNPTLGRWLSRDPLRERGGLNLYRFVRNIPTSSIDPRGLSESGSEIVGPDASIFSWIEGFSSDFDDWDPFYEAYARAHSGAEPSYGVQTGIKIAVSELSISANPTPGRVYDSKTKETRGRVKMALTINCCKKGTVTQARLSTLEVDPGYTPIRALAGGEVIRYDAADGKKPGITGLGNLGGSCITVTVLHQSRVGAFGQAAAAVFTGTGVPWIGRMIEYTLCCNHNYTIVYSGTHFPSHKAYLNDFEIGRWNQTDLASFMFTGGGILAPMKVFAKAGTK